MLLISFAGVGFRSRFVKQSPMAMGQTIDANIVVLFGNAASWRMAKYPHVHCREVHTNLTRPAIAALGLWPAWQGACIPRRHHPEEFSAEQA